MIVTRRGSVTVANVRSYRWPLPRELPAERVDHLGEAGGKSQSTQENSAIRQRYESIIHASVEHDCSRVHVAAGANHLDGCITVRENRARRSQKGSCEDGVIIPEFGITWQR